VRLLDKTIKRATKFLISVLKEPRVMTLVSRRIVITRTSAWQMSKLVIGAL